MRREIERHEGTYARTLVLWLSRYPEWPQSYSKVAMSPYAYQALSINPNHISLTSILLLLPEYMEKLLYHKLEASILKTVRSCYSVLKMLS